MVTEEPKILAVDTSSQSGSVALCCGATPVAESLLNVGKTHSEILLHQITSVVADAGWALSDLDLLVAVNGPGSFTGLRIGLATVKGLAQVLKKPVRGVSSLEALAAGQISSPEAPVCAFMDARKKEVYAQLFGWQEGALRALNQARVLAPERLLQELTGDVVLVGSGVPVYRDLIVAELGRRALIPPPAAHQLRAALCAWPAWSAWKRGDCCRADELAPLYIRPSDAELNTVKRG